MGDGVVKAEDRRGVNIEGRAVAGGGGGRAASWGRERSHSINSVSSRSAKAWRLGMARGTRM